MRLQDYLEETTKFQYNNTKKIITKNLSMLEKYVSERSLDDNILLNILNASFKDDRIFFTLENDAESQCVSSGLTDFKDGTIQIDIVSGCTRHIQKAYSKNNFFDFRKNPFLKELLEVLTHELTHRRQLEKSKYIFKDMIEFNSIRDYLSFKNEIEAYASTIVSELKIRGYSPNLYGFLSYFSKGDPVIKRLLKKVYFYLKHDDELVTKLKKGLSKIK